MALFYPWEANIVTKETPSSSSSSSLSQREQQQPAKNANDALKIEPRISRPINPSATRNCDDPKNARLTFTDVPPIGGGP